MARSLPLARSLRGGGALLVIALALVVAGCGRLRQSQFLRSDHSSDDHDHDPDDHERLGHAVGRVQDIPDVPRQRR